MPEARRINSELVPASLKTARLDLAARAFLDSQMPSPHPDSLCNHVLILSRLDLRALDMSNSPVAWFIRSPKGQRDDVLVNEWFSRCDGKQTNTALPAVFVVGIDPLLFGERLASFWDDWLIQSFISARFVAS